MQEAKEKTGHGTQIYVSFSLAKLNLCNSFWIDLSLCMRSTVLYVHVATSAAKMVNYEHNAPSVSTESSKRRMLLAYQHKARENECFFTFFF